MTLDQGRFYHQAESEAQTPLVQWLPSDTGSSEFSIWSQGELDYTSAQRVVEQLVTRDFARQTIKAMGIGVEAEPQNAFLQFIHEGKKYAIYKAMVEDSDTLSTEFIVVLAKGRGELSQEVRADYANLRALHEQTTAREMRPISPQPFVVAEADGVVGFSVQYLRDHHELVSMPNEFRPQKAEFFLNTKDPHWAGYNINGAARLEWQLIRENRINELKTIPVEMERRRGVMQEVLIGRLYAAYKLLGGVPQEFSLDAGDFIVDPTQEDFDPYVTTIRGGLQQLTSDKEFIAWLESHTQTRYTMKLAAQHPQEVTYHPFEQKYVAGGIQRGIDLLTTD